MWSFTYWTQCCFVCGSSRAQNAELSNSLKALESSQQELEKRLVALQLQHQQDSTKLQTQLDEADNRSKTLQREVTKRTLSSISESLLVITSTLSLRVTPCLHLLLLSQIFQSCCWCNRYSSTVTSVAVYICHKIQHKVSFKGSSYFFSPNLHTQEHDCVCEICHNSPECTATLWQNGSSVDTAGGWLLHLPLLCCCTRHSHLGAELKLLLNTFFKGVITTSASCSI